jgi:hypothetical protein
MKLRKINMDGMSSNLSRAYNVTFVCDYMVVMVTVSRVKKEFGNSDKKFGVLKVDEKVTSVKRLK